MKIERKREREKEGSLLVTMKEILSMKQLH